MTNENGHLREFGGFTLDAERRVLWFDHKPVSLPLKEIEVLCVLTENSGEVVTKDELIGRVWADSFVEESNLSRHIYLLRKIFKEHGLPGNIIETVPRRGYRFAGEVRSMGDRDLVIERHTITRSLIEQIESPQAFVAAIPARALPVLNLRTAILVFALVAAVSAATAWRFAGTSDASSRKISSMAVLPFRAIDSTSADSNRGLGLTDILITRLSGLKRVSVRRVTSGADPKEGTQDPSEVGKKLGVDAVLDGTVYQTGDRIRVTVRFISVRDGKAVWSGEFEKPVRDELLLQSEIALRVADGLSLNLDPDERRRLTKRYTDNREAYEAYLRGRFYYDKRDPAFDPKAIAEYEKAIELDPNYALAFAGLADVYPVYAERIPEKRAGRYEHSKALLQKALALDEELAEAHTSLAWIKRMHDWDWVGSEREFKRALELDPNSYNAHMWYSLLLITLNRKDEALAEIEKAKELAPLTPSVVANYFAVRYFRQDNDKLLGAANEEKLLGGREYNSVRTFAQAYLRLGEYDKVIELVNDYNARNNERRLLTELTTAYALKGDKRSAEPLIDELRLKAKGSAELSYRLALIFADLGRHSDALDLLEKCLAERDARLVWVAAEPRFERLRAEPRYKAILKKMNLTRD